MDTVKRLRTFGITSCLFIFTLAHTNPAVAAIPAIDTVANTQIAQGTNYAVTPTLCAGENLRWSKSYGPDDMSVNASTGEVRWSIPASLPGESFHIGVKACNGDGCDTQVWILTVGSGNIIYVGPGETYTTISAGTAAALGGDTIIIRNGTYTGDNNSMINYGTARGTIPPSGAATGYTTVIADNPGRVLLDGEYDREMIRFQGNYDDRSDQAFGTYNAAHIALKGIVAGNSSYNAPIYANHVQNIKIIDCGAFNAQPASAPISMNRSNTVLIEGCYVWGQGRMGIVSYFSDNVIMRRCVARMDIQDVSGEPIGIFDMYVTHNGRMQNCIAIDTDQHQYMTGYSNAAGAFIDACGSSCYYASHRNVITTHSLALNVFNKVFISQADEDGDSDPVTFQNSVAWDMKAIGNSGADPDYYGPNLLSRDDTTIDQCTFGKWTSPLGALSNGVAINGWQNSDAITESIIYDIKDHDGSRGGVFWGYETVDHNNIYDTGTINVSSSTVTNTLTYDPTTNGLVYITRRESGSTLEADGVGADLTFMKGKSGTFFGESGFDDETSTFMWPFPHEDIIKENMANYSYSGARGNVTGARGFTIYTSPFGSPGTLTSYIWEYLGNEIPCDIYNTCDCTKEWRCNDWSDWSACVDSSQTRTRQCADMNNCSALVTTETETQSCAPTNGNDSGTDGPDTNSGSSGCFISSTP